MTESEVVTLVRKLLRQEIAPIMMALTAKNEDALRTSVKRFETDSPINGLRNIQPYGFSSRAPVGVAALTIPIDSNPTHINVVGHFDEGKPQLNDGESALYGAAGQVIFCTAAGLIHQGTKTADEPVVLGNVMKECLKDLYADFLEKLPVAYDGFGLPCTLNPVVKSAMTDQKAKYVTSASTNIVGQKNFVERGT